MAPEDVGSRVALSTSDLRSALVNRTKPFAAVAAAAFALTAGAPGAFAYAPDNPNTPQVAIEKCEATIGTQSDLGVAAGGGQKAGVVAPTNCDKFFGAPGKP